MDTFTNTILVYTANGTYLGSLLTPHSGDQRPSVSVDLLGIAFSPSGSLAVAESATSDVMMYPFVYGPAAPSIFNITAQLFAGGGSVLNTPFELGNRDNDTALYVSSRGNHEIYRIPAQQTATQNNATVFVTAQSGGLLAPQGMLFDDAGNLYLVSNGNDRVLKYDQNGALASLSVGAHD